MLIQRRVAGEIRNPIGVPAALDDWAEKACPGLAEWLTVTQWEDGSKRRTGTLMLLAEDGVWKAWLHDRDAARSCWVSAGMLCDLLRRVEEAVTGGGGEWRPDKGGGRK